MEKVNPHFTQCTTEIPEENIRNICIIPDMGQEFLSIILKLGNSIITYRNETFLDFKNHQASQVVQW